MCGIFGVLVSEGADINERKLRRIIERLGIMSETRGKESAGLHFYLPERRKNWTIKGDVSVKKLIKTRNYSEMLSSLTDNIFTSSGKGVDTPVAIIGHSRLVTNGSSRKNENNQPVNYGKITVIHNGIIVNVDELWLKHPTLVRSAEIDSEIIAAMIDSANISSSDPGLITAAVFAERL
jgi:glucosamine 6-phosphate synthetase-like amidotransferase/phosphosugar isomerase protein